MAQKMDRGKRRKGSEKDQMARAATSAGDMEYASDLTVENNPLPQKEEGKEEK